MTPPRQRILIVDDDAAMRVMIGDLVRLAGDFEVHECDDPVRAGDLARTLQPDLILLDVVMPGRNGYQVCRDLRADPRVREVPIIVLSGADEEPTMLRALEAGADDFLPKPCNVQELRAKVANITHLNRFRRLTTERERLRTLVDRSLEPLVEVDDDGRVTFANHRARELFGLPDETGYDGIAAISRHFRCEPDTAYVSLQQSRFQAGFRFAIFRPETGHAPARWFDAETLPGSESGGLLKFTEQTERVQRDVETWTFQQMISHKIRTPLTGLDAVLEAVATSPALAADPAAKELLELARQSSGRLQAVLLDILSYHNVVFGRTGKLNEAPSSTVRAVLESAAADCGIRVSHFDGLSVALESRLAGPLLPALRELCENYAKFSQAPSVGLHATCDVRVDGVHLELFAPGETPPPDVLAEFGRPYWQAQRRFTGEVPGMGLGLATARSLLRSRGGDLRFVAREGSGLCSIVSLPFPLAAETSSAEETPGSLRVP